MSPREDRYTNTEKDAGLYDRRFFSQPPLDKPTPSDLAEPSIVEMRNDLIRQYESEGHPILADEVRAMTDEQVEASHFAEFYVDEGGYA